jgi:hypothetical protein
LLELVDSITSYYLKHEVVARIEGYSLSKDKGDVGKIKEMLGRL